jgi:Alcohol dehydrogenase GroES-like domain
MISRRQFNTYGAAGPALAQGSTLRAEAEGSTATAPATASRTMRATQLTAFRRPLEIIEIPVAAPRADGAVVRVEASGICRSDWHFWNEDWTWMGLNLQLPTVLGHEWAA